MGIIVFYLRCSPLVYLVLAVLFCVCCNSSLAQSLDDASTIHELKKVIKHQQEQLNAQAKAIAALQQALADQSTPSPLLESPAPEQTVKKRSKKVNVTLYGQINRALMHVGDGHESVWRHAGVLERAAF